MGDNSLRKNSDVFHLGRTWFKTNSLGRKIRTEEFKFLWVSPSRTLNVLTFPTLCPLTPKLGVVPPACRSPGFKPSPPNLSSAPVLRAPPLLWLYLHSSDDGSLKWSWRDMPLTKRSDCNNVNSDLNPNTDMWENRLREFNSSPVT